MQPDWAFAHLGYGVILIPAEGEVIVLEFNELLRRIANETALADDLVIGRVFTDGKRKRVGDLRIFELVRSGTVNLERLPASEVNGVLATGMRARNILRSLEGEPTLADDPDYETLLRAAQSPLAVQRAKELLRSAAPARLTPSDELLRSASPESSPESNAN
jgi:hypothetical protein